jgi:glutathione S-transferase
MITLYELAGADERRRFSPYCWRIRMALLHKGLPFETIAWRFTDKQSIAFAGSDKVPVLTDGEQVIHDSPVIADYLERAYPDLPSLFGGETARALSRFILDWSELVMNPALFRMVGADIAAHVAEQDLDYFRRSREARIGTTLERYCADAQQRVPEFQASLAPLRRTLGKQDFLSGTSPAWADYVVFGVFQWARCVSPLQLLAADDSVHRWRERMLDLHDGAARKAVGYPTG